MYVGVGNEIIVAIVVESWFGGPVGDGWFELLALESKSVWRHDVESIAVVFLAAMEVICM